MAGNNFLSDKAVAQIRKNISDVRSLKKRIKLLEGGSPRVSGRRYALLGDYTEALGGYDATRVRSDVKPGTWQYISDAREWGSDASDLGLLYPLNAQADTTYSGKVVEAMLFTDGSDYAWGFQLLEIAIIKDAISGHIEAPTNKTYVLDQDAYFDGTIKDITTECVTGSASIAIQIDGTSIAWNTSPTFATSEATRDATDDNVFAAGSKITMVITGASADVEDGSFTLSMIREI